MKLLDQLNNKLETLKVEAQALLNEGKVEEAKAKVVEINDTKDAIEVQKVLDKEETEEINNKMDKKENPINEKEAANGLRAIIKASMGHKLTEAENALLVQTPGTGAGNGEGYILPQDIKTIIQKKIRQYKSFREVLGYIPTTSLTGSFPVENFETLSGLVDFTDGADGTDTTDIKFTNVSFSLKSKAAFIKLSNTLLKMTDNALIEYVAECFAKKAVVTENTMAIATLQNGKSVKAIADWKALKKSTNVDLDPGVLFGMCYVTNQDGFDVLDSALDATGRPVLQPMPGDATKKTFMGYPVEVFSNAMLPTVGTSTKKAPIFYGNLREAVKFVDTNDYAFATSEHAGFMSNTTVARVIEHVDVVQVDKSDKIYVYGELTIA